jgi:hypothetical protein
VRAAIASAQIQAASGHGLNVAASRPLRVASR